MEREASVAVETPPLSMLLEGVNTVFESLGRGLICLTPDFRVLQASPGLDRLLATEVAESLTGRPVEEVLGEELFGAGAGLREALEAGEKREGWGATLSAPGERPRPVSLSAAPLRHDLSSLCDPRVGYLVVVRPAEEALPGERSATTVFSGIVARSASMRRIFDLLRTLADSEATVLVSGESGTGKELVARALHAHSLRRGAPFLAVNCGALPGELLESELFGHVRGAFTGAVRDREGRFEAASDGTLFLDEIGDMPLPSQVKLLRVLQERTFERVGENRSRETRARIIAASNADLRRAVLEGRFRDDLYYRLRVVPIEVPPLRERREDVEPLARHLLSRITARHGRSLMLTPQAMRALLAYHWPGNVRELENALEYAVAVCQGQTIQVRDLPDEVQEGRGALEHGAHEAATLTTVPVERVRRPPTPAFSPSTPPPGGSSASQPAASGAAVPPPSQDGAGDAAGDSERTQILAALETHRWKREEAAAALGFSRTTLWRKMREYGLQG